MASDKFTISLLRRSLSQVIIAARHALQGKNQEAAATIKTVVGNVHLVTDSTSPCTTRYDEHSQAVAALISGAYNLARAVEDLGGEKDEAAAQSKLRGLPDILNAASEYLQKQ